MRLTVASESWRIGMVTGGAVIGSRDSAIKVAGQNSRD
jgi:hypothetical protein